MQLLLWLEEIELWRLERERGTPKQEDTGESEDTELPEAMSQ